MLSNGLYVHRKQKQQQKNNERGSSKRLRQNAFIVQMSYRMLHIGSRQLVLCDTGSSCRFWWRCIRVQDMDRSSKWISA